MMLPAAGKILKRLGAEEPNYRGLEDQSSVFPGDRPDAGGCDASEWGQPGGQKASRQRSHPSFVYDMERTERGCFIIFDQVNFDKHLQLRTRNGSETDHFKLELIAKSLGFEWIQTFHDKTSREILYIVDILSKANHNDYDCFACAILSHGGKGDLVYSKDSLLKLSEITSPFEANNCPTLAGKPKLFFIQACRGTNRDDGALVRVPVSSVVADAIPPEDCVDQIPTSDAGEDKEMQTIMIPAQADFLIAHASSPDHCAFLNGTSGSWFIDSLKRCVEMYGNTMELMQIMTKVNNMVANWRENGCGSMQIPSIASRLRSEVYFKQKQKDHQNLPTRSTEEMERKIFVQTESRDASVHKGFDQLVLGEKSQVVVSSNKPQVVADEW